MKPGLIHQGSVKDIYRISESELMFRFSDRYSIFDWGAMPDAIPGKGQALATMGKKFFKYLEQESFQTHYVRDGEDSRDLVVKSVRVPRGEEQIYQDRPSNILIPLEVIFRFGVAKGSSLLKRYQSDVEWIRAGFERAYQEGEFFSEVKIDFTTKLEAQDRALSHLEAKKLSGMNDEEWKSLLEKTGRIAFELKKVISAFGAKLWDGKFEFAFDSNRKIMLVDSIGLDEMRLTFEGVPLSKEILRQHYLKSSWYKSLMRAKELHPKDFKNFCQKELHSNPDALPAVVVNATAALYQTIAELVFCNAEDLKPLQEKLKQSISYLARPL